MSVRETARHALATAVFFFLFLSYSFCPAATPSLQKVVITFADFSERAGLLFVAKDQRLFEEPGRADWV